MNAALDLTFQTALASKGSNQPQSASAKRTSLMVQALGGLGPGVMFRNYCDIQVMCPNKIALIKIIQSISIYLVSGEF